MRPASVILSAVALSTLVTIGLLRSPLASSSDDQVVTEQLVLEQTPPVIKHFNIGEPGRSDGDVLHVFNAPFTGVDGLKGTLHGQMVTVDLPDGDDQHADRLVNLTFDFGEGNTLVVSGQSRYPKDAEEMRAGDAQPRAIIGGTGRFAGADGVVISLRNENGSYTHTVTYRTWGTL